MELFKHVAPKLAVIGVLAATAGGIAGCAATHHAGRAPAAASPSASHAGAATSRSSCSQLTAWASGGGLTNLATVGADVNADVQDADAADAGNPAALEADGPKLTTDAEAALATALPGSADYVTVMTDLVQAGNDMTAGDLAGAYAELNAAVAPMNAVDAAIPASCS